MHVGVSVGPYVERIPSLPPRFAFAEIGLGEGEITLEALDPDGLSARLADAHLGSVVHLPYRQPLSTGTDRIDAATVEYLDDVLTAAATIGADRAVAHPNARGAGHDSDALAARMKKLTARGQAHDVTVCYETTGYAGGPKLPRVGELAARADAAVCLDVGYAYLEAGTTGITEFLRSYGDMVEHLHVHGARRRGDTHIPVGSGDVAYDALAGPIAQAAPKSATIEVFTDDTRYLTSSADRFTDTLSGEC